MWYSMWDIFLLGRNGCVHIAYSGFALLHLSPGCLPSESQPCGSWKLHVFDHYVELPEASILYLSLVAASVIQASVIICSMSRSLVSWLSLNLHLFACKLHLATKSSIFSVFLFVLMQIETCNMKTNLGLKSFLPYKFWICSVRIAIKCPRVVSSGSFLIS